MCSARLSQRLSEYPRWCQARPRSRVCPPPAPGVSWSLATSTPASQIWPVTSTSVPQVTDIFLPTVPEAHQWQQPRLVLEPSLSSNRLWHTRSCKQQRFYLYIDILIRGLKCNNDEVIVSTRTYEVKWCDKSTNLDKLVLSIDFCGGLIWYFISAVLSKVLFWNNYSYSLFSKTWRWKINDHKG